MLRQSFFVLLASLIVVLLATELAFILNYMDRAHLMLAGLLAKVFAGGTVGSIIRHTIALFLIPFIIALIPALIYYLAKKSSFPYFVYVIWVCWIILATMLIVR